MKKNWRSLMPLRFFACTILTICFVQTGFTQNSFYKKYLSTQVLSGVLLNSVGVSTSQSEYYFTGMKTLLVTGTDGTIHWGREFTYNGEILIPGCIDNTLDGGYIIGGHSFDSFTLLPSNFLIKLDSLGNTVWVKSVQLNNTNGYILQVVSTDDGGYGICANTGSDSTTLSGAWIAKTDGQGNLLWTRILRHTASSTGIVGNSIENTSDGGFIVAGKIMFFNSERHTSLTRLDASGNVLWTQTISGASINEWPYAAQCSDGSFIVSGCGYGGIYELARLSRTDSLGNLLWTKLYGTNQTAEAICSVQQTSDGGFILGGTTVDYNTNIGFPYFIKTDANGDTLWTKKLFVPEVCVGGAQHITETPDGGYIFPVGSIGLVKTDPNGYISCGSLPIQTQVFDTVMTQTYSVAFSTGGSVSAGAIQNTLLPVTDSILCTGEFETVGIASPENDLSFTLYPNPSNGIFIIENPYSGEEVDLEIFNATGALVFARKNLGRTAVIDLSREVSGVYFVRMGNGMVYRVVKVVKE